MITLNSLFVYQLERRNNIYQTRTEKCDFLGFYLAFSAFQDEAA